MKYVTVLAWIITIGLPILTAIQVYATYTAASAATKLLAKDKLIAEIIKKAACRFVMILLAVLWLIIY